MSRYKLRCCFVCRVVGLVKLKHGTFPVVTYSVFGSAAYPLINAVPHLLSGTIGGRSLEVQTRMPLATNRPNNMKSEMVDLRMKVKPRDGFPASF